MSDSKRRNSPSSLKLTPAAKPASRPASKLVASPYSAPKSGVKPAQQTPAASVSGSGSAKRFDGRQNGRFKPKSGPAARPFLAQRATTPRLSGLAVPCVVVSRRASDTLRAGHLWVYATDVEQTELGTGEAPALMPVVDNRGIPLGTALYSPASQIALRMVSRELITTERWAELLAERLRTAIGRRKPLFNAETNAGRLVFSEADDLPGVIVDRYAGIVVLQLLSKGLDNQATREICTRVIREEIERIDGPITIWERPDPRIRELEGISAPAITPLYSTDANAPASGAEFRLNGLSFHFDVNSGQKTGAFLDQRQNYAAVAGWAKALGGVRKIKKALDVCTYQGGFALHLAKFAERVTGIDASRSSLEVAEKNLEANKAALKAEVDWVEADAFELLRAWSESPETSDFDLIVLDPPAFAKSKRAVEGALRGYKELNLRALKMVRSGGLLVTCSCSHHVSWTDLEGAVASAAVDAHRRVTLLERRGAAQDHPVLLHLPETEYLKCLICRVD
jgi:23S rRNA (cytosine1962-C5)-methyltransferase